MSTVGRRAENHDTHLTRRSLHRARKCWFQFPGWSKGVRVNDSDRRFQENPLKVVLLVVMP